MDPLSAETIVSNCIANLIGVSSLILIHKITAKIQTSIYLVRDASQLKGSIVRDRPFIDSKTVEERKRELSREKINQLEFYVRKLQEYTSEENLKTVYRNLKTLQVKKKIGNV